MKNVSQHPQYGDKYTVKHGNREVEVYAWSRRNARLSGSRKLGVKPNQVQVSDNPFLASLEKLSCPPLQTNKETNDGR